MTTTDFAGLISDVETIQAARAKAEAAAVEAAAKADAVSQEADDARAAAEAQAQQARNQVSNSYTSIMRRLTAEVRDARAAAFKTVIETPDQAFPAWLEYRRVRAANQGTWLVIGGQYSGITNRPAPPGEWGPAIVVAPGTYGTDRGETFNDFISAAVAEWETKQMQQAQYARSEELIASKTAVNGGNQ